MVWRITHAHPSFLLAGATTLALDSVATITTLVVLARFTKVVVLVALAESLELTIYLTSETLSTTMAR